MEDILIQSTTVYYLFDVAVLHEEGVWVEGRDSLSVIEYWCWKRMIELM